MPLLLVLVSSILAIEIIFKSDDGHLNYIIENGLRLEDVPGDPIFVRDTITVAFEFTKSRFFKKTETLFQIKN